MTPWSEVSQKKEYLQLPPEQQDAAKNQYFSEMVAPHVPEQDIELARNQFLNSTKTITPSEKSPSFLGQQLKGVKRIAGVGLGVVNSPLAYVWGSLEEPYKDSEGYAKLPLWEKVGKGIESGLESAWRSISKEGDFGTLYGEFVQTKTGKTILENVRDDLKIDINNDSPDTYAAKMVLSNMIAPTVETVMNLISDPLVGAGEAARLAQLKIPKGFKGKINDPKIIQELESLNKLEGAERQAVQKRLMEVLNNRGEYINWWETTLAEKEAAQSKVGPPLLKPGERDIPGLTAPRNAIAGVPKRDFSVYIPQQKAELIQPPTETIKDYNLIPESNREAINIMRDEVMASELERHPKGYVLASTFPDWFKKKGWSKKDFINIIDKAEAGKELTPKQSTKLNEWLKISEDLKKTHPTLVTGADALSLEKKGFEPVYNNVLAGDLQKGDKLNIKGEIFEHKGLDEIGNIILKDGETVKLDFFDSIKIDGIKTLGKTETTLTENTKRINDFRKSKGLSPFTAKATGGMILGISEDEDGNVTYDVGKGLAGALIVGGGLKIKSKSAGKLMGAMARSPAWSKVHGMVGKTSKPFEFAGILGRLNTTLFDRFAPIQKASPKTYEAARSFSSYKDQAVIQFDELKDVLKPVKNDEVLMTDYISAHRAASRARRGLENPNNVTIQDARQAILEIENQYANDGKNVQHLRDALEGFHKWAHNNILQKGVESGLISEAGAKSIVRNNDFYATFEVLDMLPPNINDIPSLPGKEYFSVSNQSIIKKMVGTEKQIANPIESTIRKFTNAQATFARNKVASVFIDDPNTKGMFRPVAMTEKELAAMKKQGLDPVFSGAWNKKEFDTINRFKDGNLERYVVPIEIAETMKQLTPKQAPRVIKALNAVFRSSATTLYLPFTISNTSRDALMAYTSAPVYSKGDAGRFLKDWAEGLKEGIKHEFGGKSDIAKEYIKSGGSFGYAGNLRQARAARADLFKKGIVRQASDIITSPLKLIEKVSASIELAPRLGVFERAKMKGTSSKDAAMLARQSTIDFNRGGTLTKVVNQFVPFLNARVQGRVTLAQALRKDPKGTLAKTAISVGLPGMAAYAWNRLYYSDLYDDIPEHIKQNYFILIAGTETDTRGKENPRYIVMSKGDIGQMAWNPIEFGLDQAYKKDTKGATDFFVNYLSDLSPVDFARDGDVSPSKIVGGLLPPVVKGVAEDWANLSFYTGREIVPYYMGKSKPPELQYKENTPETYKWLGKKVGISPLRLQNFASSVLAGYGREGLDPSSMLRGLTGRIVKTVGGEKEQQAWTVIKDIEQGYIYTRAYADEMVKNENREGAVKLLTEWNAGLQKRVTEYNKQFKDAGLQDKGGILNSYTFTPAKKKTLLLQRKDNRTALEKKISRQR